jgi:hypothetical protein
MITVIDIFEELVSDISDLYGKQVQAYSDHLISVNGQLAIRSRSAEGIKNKYPGIFLVLDTAEKRNSTARYEFTTRPQIFVMDNSAGTRTAKTRSNDLFKPVLYPIYECFMDSLRRSIRIMNTEYELAHTKVDRYRFSGSLNEACRQQGIKAMFPDYLDAIEIRDLELNIRKECY